MVSATQDPQALSSGESESYGLVQGACVAVGFVNMATDFGRTLKGDYLEMLLLPAVLRTAVEQEKLRHIESKTSWLQ
eukprot:8165938-Karenia_brevis.AAC.1